MPRRLTRRETEIFSISFLDCITCGLGSVVLLLVLSDVRSPEVEQDSAAQAAEIAKLQDELVDIEGQRASLDRDLKSRQEQLSIDKLKVARLLGDLNAERGKYQASNREADVANALQGKLASAQESLTDEMKRLLGKGFRRKSDSAIGGIPVDSEYIIFLIDTSGSMQSYEWPTMLQKVQESLDIYPHLKGFQVMNDQGTYMFPSYTGKWIPDT
ncbi:MAG: VWA domain-containing protein, partial [Povalibacter sp.]